MTGDRHDGGVGQSAADSERNEAVERDDLPHEVYGAHVDYVRLAMKTMTAQRMIGWLRDYADYSDVAGNTKTAEDARYVANRLAAEVEPESVEDHSPDTGEDHAE